MGPAQRRVGRAEVTMNDLSAVSERYWAGAALEQKETHSATPGGGFADLLASSLDRVDRLQTEADRAVEDLTLGRQADIHSTMIAVEKAGVALELAMQIRNKLLNAYETLMRQQV
jgi:flagellar hook-basal body complex protein FliE